LKERVTEWDGVRAMAGDCERGKALFNPLTPKDIYNGRTAPLTSKSCISYIYSTNAGTEYIKHGIDGPFFIFKMQFVS